MHSRWRSAGIAAFASLLVVVPATLTFAVTLNVAGPSSGTVSNVASSGGDHVWVNPTRAQVSDNSYATSDLTNSGNPSTYLEAKSLGFSVPTGATINGITVTIERHQQCGGGPCSSSVTDKVVRLLKAGSFAGSNLASTTAWGGSDTTGTYGGSSNLWGTTWTPADVNNVDFGVALQVQRDNGGDRTAYVDYMAVTVNYTPALTNQTISVTTHAPATAIYGDSFPVAATGGGSGNPVVITTGGSCSGGGSNSATIAMTSGAGTCSVFYNQAGNGSYNPASQITETVSANQRPITISMVAGDKVYDGTVIVTGVSWGTPAMYNIATGDAYPADINFDPTTGTHYNFSDKNVGTGKSVTASGVTLIGTKAANYVLSQPTSTASITPRSLTVTAGGVNKTYDGTTAATVTLATNAIGSDAVTASYTSAVFATSSVGTSIAVHVEGISIGGADAVNYTLGNTTADTTADITTASASVTLDAGQNLAPTYDGLPKPLTFSTTATGLTPVVTYNGNSTPPVNAGTYTVVAALVDPNYAGSDTETLVIGKAIATVSVTPYAATYDVSAHTAVGTAKGVGEADLSGSLTLSGTTHTNVGTYATDPWTFAGGTNYTDQSGTVSDSIAKADPTITVTPYTVTFDGNPHTAVGTAKGVLGETLAGLDLTATTHTATSTYTDPWTFTDVTGNYNNAAGTVSDTISDKPTRTLSYAAGANGSLTGQTTQSVIDGGDGTAVTAVANSDYHFVNWSDGATQNPRTDMSVTSNISVTANFAANQAPQSTTSHGDNGMPVGLGGIGVNGAVLGASSSTVTEVVGGRVLGMSTTTTTSSSGGSCELLINSYMRRGMSNNVSDVKKLQQFLNQELSMSLPVTGFFGKSTEDAVRSFQTKYASDILSPWGITDPTGYVYKMTKWKINSIVCPSQSGPKPEMH